MWKNMIQKLSVNTIVLAVYLFFVWSIYLFVNFYREISSITIFLEFLLACAIMTFFISKGLMLFVSKIPSVQCAILTPKKMILSYCIFSLISFSVFSLWYIAYYPGAFSPDSIWQYQQATTNYYSDWHPVWHTLLFFSFPLALTGKTASIVFFQMIYFSLILGYFTLSIYQFSNCKAAIISLGYILLNPYTGCIIMYPWKDVAMAIVILWSMVCITKIYYTNGQWGLKKGRIVLLAVLLANATLFRHNAVLFTVPMILVLFFQLKRRKWLELLILFFACIFMIKVPIYSSLKVEKPGQRRLETMGLPLTVIANVTKEHPELLNEKTSAFVYQMASQEDWEEKYICGDFNKIKYYMDASIIDETSTLDILSMMLNCFKIAPQSSYEALFMLTDMVYAVEGPIRGDFSPEISNNDFEIVYKGNEMLRDFLLLYKKIVASTVFKYIQYIGLSILIMIIFILNKSDLKNWNDWKRILLCMPIFTYNFGTMLLLTSPDSRFFYVSYLVCPLVVLIMLKDREEILL